MKCCWWFAWSKSRDYPCYLWEMVLDYRSLIDSNFWSEMIFKQQKSTEKTKWPPPERTLTEMQAKSLYKWNCLPHAGTSRKKLIWFTEMDMHLTIDPINNQMFAALCSAFEACFSQNTSTLILLVIISVSNLITFNGRESLTTWETLQFKWSLNEHTSIAWRHRKKILPPEDSMVWIQSLIFGSTLEVRN